MKYKEYRYNLHKTLKKNCPAAARHPINVENMPSP